MSTASQGCNGGGTVDRMDVSMHGCLLGLSRRTKLYYVDNPWAVAVPSDTRRARHVFARVSTEKCLLLAVRPNGPLKPKAAQVDPRTGTTINAGRSEDGYDHNALG